MELVPVSASIAQASPEETKDAQAMDVDLHTESLVAAQRLAIRARRQLLLRTLHIDCFSLCLVRGFGGHPCVFRWRILEVRICPTAHTFAGFAVCLRSLLA
jgi:hypothetical protein